MLVFDNTQRAEADNQPVSLMLPGVLRDFDLPDVLAAIAPRPLLVLNPTKASTEMMDGPGAEEALSLVRHAYGSTPAPSALRISAEPFESDTVTTLEKWVAEQ